ncbi:hypothetical protein BABINDRAFT_163000 [Babjeviella inositovora NRRL Y-12698]|uniref:USP domain-containing protein n=1 Tax=Babjeviella inositovora NRRL Y-12698 TaxID=984486 RepID=A0A1E3QJU0_9ASCO|nr:uncharacterized protein BABINDRAFT_163000 [Babjeviella inositovora NRRL Y-12698]ODQ77949.1 hypothetical protein BABINDRAFT_163000 [Babjeviella inositovora NRRL Y-12698]
MTPYTSFYASQTDPVLRIMNHQKGILSLTSNSLKFTTRRGMPKFCVEGGPLRKLTAMSYSSANQHEVVLGSNNPSSGKNLCTFDLIKNCVTRTASYTDPVLCMALNVRQTVIGKQDGGIDIFDSRSDSVTKTFVGHSGTLADIDCKDHTLVTCGFSHRHNGYMVDPIVNVYDLRVMRPLSPLLFAAGASFVRLHPKFPNVAVVASALGQIQFIDMYNHTNVHLYQADVGGYMSSMEISPSGDYIAMADGFQMQLWSHGFNAQEQPPSMAVYANALDYATNTFPEEPFGVDDDVPLNTIGMPFYKEVLLSNWSTEMRFPKSGCVLPKHIDEEMLRRELIAHYDRDKYGARNSVARFVPPHMKKQGKSPKFISERLNEDCADACDEDIFSYVSSAPNVVPPCYGKLEIFYSRFGVDDYDFDYYNKTQYSGLETQIENSYVNAIVQLYRFVPEVFNIALQSIASVTDLQNPSLLAELGYLFDMLHKARGKNVRLANFQKTFTALPETLAMNLLDVDNTARRDKTRLRKLVLGFNRFLSERLAFDARSLPTGDVAAMLGQSMGTVWETEIGSNYCSSWQSTASTLFSIGMPAPPKLGIRKFNHSIVTFLEYALSQQLSTTPFCPNCRKYHLFEVTKVAKSLPPVLSLNLEMSEDDFRDLRGYRNWLLPEFYASMNKGRPVLKPVTTSTNTNEVRKYELFGYVAQITNEKNDSHLVSFVKIDNQHTRKSEWFLFNDFMVTPIPESEVFNMTYWWKTPLVIVYKHCDTPAHFDVQAFRKPRLDDTVLYRDNFAAGLTKTDRIIEYELLTQSEAPEPGTLMAIDAEFVELEPEAIEIRSDGTRSLIRPKRQALARVSVTRGDNGPMQGVPLIDDYIVTVDHISDYLTSFSGIELNDLNPQVSKHSLVTLQTAYRRLWLLLNLGCVFVGHSVGNDFRTINIHVPPSQVRDTAQFFYLPEMKRRLSLKFLAYILLKENVQRGNHDSIEDANTALRLYKRYLELKATGELENTLHKVYQEGQYMKFRPPGDLQ